MRLTLRTLLAYLDDTLDPAMAREIGKKLTENPPALELVDRLKRVTRKRGLGVPASGTKGDAADPNLVAQYLSDTLTPEQVTAFEKTCLDSDVNLAEVAACHQILTLVLSEQVRVPPPARRRMYGLVGAPASLPNRKPGKTVPVGGTRDAGPPPDDRIDAAFLLGMSAYTAGEKPAVRFARLAVIGLVATVLVVAATMAWPRHQDAPRETAALPTVPPVALAVPAKADPVKPDAELVKDPSKAELLPPPKALDAPQGPEVEPVKPTPAVEPPKEAGPPPAASADRVVIGQWEKREPTPVLVRQTPTNPVWTRVPADAPDVISTDRLTCLPGYKATVKLESNVVIDLWGNLPDLFLGSPILEASLTPTFPARGFDADLTVHTGRFYVSTKRPGGAAVRLRFATEVWDVVLADDKTDVVLEVSRELVPGPASAVRVSVGLHVNAGSATVTAPALKAVVLGKAGELYWDSATGKSRAKPDPDARTKADRSAYWSKFPVFPDAARAKASLAALDEFSKKIADPNRVRATFDESLQDRPESATLQTLSTARVAVLMFAGLGDVNGLADCLNDPNRPFIREAAVLGLRSLFAADPGTVERFREVLVGKARLPEDEADMTVRLLRGFTPAQRGDPDTLTLLGNQLSSPAVPVRDLAFYTLLGYLDPKDPAAKQLLAFDAAASSEARAASTAAWGKKIDELKKKVLAPQP
jgi:hypothetical protein